MSRPLFRLRDIMPKGLYWRTLLIIVAPAALLQLIITLVFLDDHWQATSKRMSQGVAADVALIIQLYEREPTPENFADLQTLALRPLRLEIELQPDAALAVPRCRPWGSTLDRHFLKALRQDIGREIFYDSTCPGPQVIIRVQTPSGILQLKAFRDRLQARSGPLFVMWISGATLFLCIVSVIFIRNQVRPIEQLAEAMERFGRGEDGGLFRARGAREVRGATLAFFDMRQRIKRYIEQRQVDGLRYARLADLFAMVKTLKNDKVRFNIETKISPFERDLTPSPEVFVDALLKVIDEHGVQSRVTLQSFDWRTLKIAQQKAPRIPTVYLSAQQKFLDNINASSREGSAWTAGLNAQDFGGSVARMVKAAGGAIWSPYFGDVDQAKVKDAQALGLKVVVWTVNELQDIEQMLDWKVDGIITDYPDRARTIMDRRNLLPR